MKITPETLARYLADELPEDECRLVFAWLQAHPEMRAQLEGIPPRGTPDFDSVLARLDERRTPQPRIRFGSDRPPSAFRRGRRASVAAAVVVVLVAAVATLIAVRQTGEGETYVAAAGSRSAFTLDDGTEIVLNAVSRLVVPDEYGEQRRGVDLEGEAYFDVAADADRPFTIRASGATVTVLGTAFNVDAYAGEPLAVVVAEGTVRLQGRSGSVAELRSGDRGRVISSTGRIVTDRVPIEDAIAWTARRLVFRAAPLADVARRLEREYGVRIRVQAGLEARRLDASFDRLEIDRIADLIAAALDADARVEGDSVIFFTSEAMP